MIKVLALFALLFGLAACDAGYGTADNGRGHTYAAVTPWQSVLAQASIGNEAASLP